VRAPRAAPPRRRRGADARAHCAARSGVPEAEKAALRDALLSLAAAEEAPPVALQLALAVARVARFDHPREWCGARARAQRLRRRRA
jgi:hypothetical protein